MSLAVWAVVFDLDGVLADSEPWWNEIDAKMLAEYGVNYRGEYHQEVLGISYQLAVDFYKKAFGLTVPPDEMMRRRGEIAAEFFVKHIGLFPSTRNVLHELRRMHLPLALATSSVSASARPFLDRHGLTDLFQAIITGDDVERGKPAPDIYVRAAAELGISPDACLVIEDSLSGVAAAKAAKMRVAAIPDTRFVNPAAYKEQADYLLANLSEIPSLVRRLNSDQSCGSGLSAATSPIDVFSVHSVMGGISLIQIPYDSGHYNARMGNGPAALIARGLPDRLSFLCQVETVEVRLLVGFHSEAQALVALQHPAATATRDAINQGKLPILLSGNCGTAALSATAALGPHTGVIWFDAHGDCNTPETSASGFLDGMCLAILTGQCWSKLTARLESFSAIPGENVIQIGVRHVDPEEKLLLEFLKIIRISSDRTDLLAPAVNSLSEHTNQFYVHLDADVLDISEGAANTYACAGGLTRQQLNQSVRTIADSNMVGAIGITSYDPASDTEGRIAEILIEAATILVS